ncbi:MAG: PH domain-containing protein [Candidatus Lokiarchaeota archaeon]|nr:PH domain-containing protein [Candidatus Lokiarchaeota archaeon]
MKEDELKYEGTISKEYVKKETLKMFIGLSIFVFGSIAFVIPILIGIELDKDVVLDWTLLIIILASIILGIYVIMLFLNRKYLMAYYKTFSYAILEDKIVINHGVFTKTRATIPYSRIQNINIVSGVFDRIYKTFTVKIETAGSSAAAASAQSGHIRPEGYIPGLKDPHVIEKKINEMMTKYSQIPSGLEDKIFKPEELAFDNFISYIMSKMREGENLKTNIKELMTKYDISEIKLAEQVGVPLETIKYLIEGRYNPSLALACKIARVFSCKIEELFELS